MSLAWSMILLVSQTEGGVPPPDEAVDCTEALTQQAMNRCAAMEWQAADEALNVQWRATRQEMRRLDANVRPEDGRPGYFAQLLSAQRAWLSYRDNHCASVGYGARGGSLEPLLVANCKTALTRARMEELRELAQYPR